MVHKLILPVKTEQAFMVVTTIGDNTFVGRADTLVGQASGGQQDHFTNIGIILLVLIIITLLLVWSTSFYRTDPIVTILRFTLGITIIGVPVGLPAVVTTTMAVAAQYLAKKKIIKRLNYRILVWC